MRIARTLAELHTARATLGPAVSLVPTMGALHDGHLALLAAARAAGLPTAASIFVNPLQFAPHEDFSAYPRSEESDLEKLEAGGCDLVWLPDLAAMYPPGAATTIHVEGPATRWEGALRPGHFSGVATVVAKLFGQIRPSRAYFGEKDFQQIRVIARMAEDLLFPIEIIPVPTVRELDGLALSSRNRFLSRADRATAPILYATLQTARVHMRAGAPVAETLATAAAQLEGSGLAPDYLSVVDPNTLEPLTALGRSSRLLAAAKLGPVRLLDNIAV